MSSPVNPARSQSSVAPSVALVYSLFFLSGIAALIYEASWSRLVGLAIGQTAHAAALVLAAYFAGLSIGQFLGGRLAARVPPLLGYGVAELVAAAWAFFIPTLVSWVGASVEAGEFEMFRDSTGGRAAWCFFILLQATIPLGATLPFAVEALAARSDSPHRASLAYGLNTVGGLVGIIAASAFLLVVFGVRASGYLAAALSVACGAIACLASPSQHRSNSPSIYPFVGIRLGSEPVWMALATISGFGILGIEVLYTRMFSLVFHNSVYTFGAVVAAFLLALSTAAPLASWLCSRSTPRIVAAASLSLGGLALAVSVVVFPRLTGLRYFSSGESFVSYLVGVFGLIALFVIPPVTLLGMTLPAAIHSVRGGRAVGELAAVNTLAGAIGAIAAGFFLPETLGLWSAFGAFVLLFAGCGAMMLTHLGRRKLAVVMAMMMALPAALIVCGPTSGRGLADGETLVQRWESAYGWVDVVQSRKGSLQLRQNLHYQHGSTANATREYRQGTLPLLLHPKPAEIAFLGLGTGLTAAPAVIDNLVEKAVIVELIPEVVKAARRLELFNLGVLENPKVEVHIDDARSFLFRSRRQFDAIVSDLFVPWESRTGYLYTVEFYETVRRRLKPGGLFCQWLAVYQFGPEQLQLVADSFSSVFPHTTVWWGQFDARYAIIALVGSDQPLVVDPLALEERMAALDCMPTRADPDLRIPSDLPALFIGGWPRDVFRTSNTDEHPWLEFTAPVSHRAGQTLHGPALRRYFDAVLSRLPFDGVRFGGELDALRRDEKRRRALQRLSLFGDAEQ